MLIQKYRSKINSSAAVGDWLFLLFIAIAIWVSRFLGFRSFGLYEDDFAFIGGLINLSFPELIARLQELNFATQGRPIGFGIDYISAWSGYQLGGLSGVYIIAYSIVLINAILFYFLLKRLLPDIYAKIGTLAYAVFPADTTQAFLTHALILQPSLTFFLIATHLYLSRKFLVSYLFITLSLLSYEVVFPVFLAVPLLEKGSRANLKTKLIKNFVILLAIFVIVYFLRKISGEERATKIPFYSFFQNVFYGPFISLSQYASRPVYAGQQIVERFDVYGNLLPILILLGVCLYLFCLHYRKQLELGNSSDLIGQTRPLDKKYYLSTILKYSLWILLVGFVALFLSYLLTFTNPVFIVAGRGSRVHLAAVFGAAVIVGAICSFALLFAKYLQNKLLSYHVTSVLLATFFTLLIAFGFMIQQSYKESWIYQKQFWNNLVEICPDLSDGTNIFVEVQDDQLRYSTFIETLSWPTPFVLELIYDFPKSWAYLPRVWLVEKDWHKNLKMENNRLMWQTPEWFWPFRLVNSQMSNTILVKLTTNGIMRSDQADSIQFKALPAAKELPVYPRKNLYHLLLNERTS